MKYFLAIISFIAALLPTIATAGPTVTINEERRGSWVFAADGVEVVDDLTGCDALIWNFTWGAVPEDATSGVEYRYGFDILDINDDQQFDTDWGDFTVAPPRRFFFGVHILTVQARDDAGAITTANIQMNIITGDPLPTLTVSEASRGAWDFIGTTGPGVSLTEALVVPAIPWVFSWVGLGCNSGNNSPLDYRYGFDITDPADDTQWSPWGPGTTAAPRTFVAGSHNFMVETRDTDGHLTRAVITIQIMATVSTEETTWGAVKSIYRD